MLPTIRMKKKKASIEPELGDKADRSINSLFIIAFTIQRTQFKPPR